MITYIIDALIGLCALVLGFGIVYVCGMFVEIVFIWLGQPKDDKLSKIDVFFAGLCSLCLIGAAIAISILIGEGIRSLF